MKIYCDTSVLVAWFHPADVFANVVTDWLREKPADILWNVALRAETRHSLRRLKTHYARTAWNALRAAEHSRRLVLGKSFSETLLEDLDGLSAQFAASVDAGTWDFFHVAAAQRDDADWFATCDAAQAELAKEVGLATRLFKTTSR